MWKAALVKALMSLYFWRKPEMQPRRPFPSWELPLYSFQMDWFVKASDIQRAIEEGDVDMEVRFVLPNQEGSHSL